MSKKRRNKKSLHLTDKKHPMLAIIATGLGFLSIVLFFAFCILSGTQKGKAGLLIGLGGFICIIISGIGFLAAWASLHLSLIHIYHASLPGIWQLRCI